MDRNQFGGGNPNSLYVPMSEDEQEILLRLVESQSLRIKVHTYNLPPVIPKKVSYGDKRVQVTFRVDFGETAPKVPTRVESLDIELCTEAGLCLFRKPYPTVGADGHPIQVVAGMYLDLMWDIAIDFMEPALVKYLKPGAFGLTTRRLDRDTGNRTVTGNLSLSEANREALRKLDRAEAYVRTLDPRQKS